MRAQRSTDELLNPMVIFEAVAMHRFRKGTRDPFHRIGYILAVSILVVQFGASASRGEEISPDEADRLWESIRRLSQVLPPDTGAILSASPSVRVRLQPEKIRVPHWEESIRVSIDVAGVNHLGAFFAELEYGPGLALPSGEFVSAGPLWTQFNMAQPDQEVPLPEGDGSDGSAIIFGLNPRRGITGDGTLAVVELLVREPGSTTVKLKQFLWMGAGDSRVMRRAEILGNVQVDIFRQKPLAYLSFVAPGTGAPPVEGSSRLQRQAPAGETFPVFLCVEGVAGAVGLTFSVDFDRNGLQFVGIREGEMVRSAGKTLSCFDSAQRVSAIGRLYEQGIALLDPGSRLRGGGCVAEILFLARGNPSASIRLRSVAGVYPGEETEPQSIEVRDPDIPLTVTRLR